jgi:hypothetical protein
MMHGAWRLEQGKEKDSQHGVEIIIQTRYQLQISSYNPPVSSDSDNGMGIWWTELPFPLPNSLLPPPSLPSSSKYILEGLKTIKLAV